MSTSVALQASSGDHQHHEGLVLWLGRTVGTTTLVLACAAPPTRSGPDRVHVDAHAVGATARASRAHGLGIVAQVHSHPGHDTRHSDGDDQLVLMPFEGMFSLVVADYGRGSLLPEQGAGLHQHQNGRWVNVDDCALHLIPSAITIPSP
jgi:proteasome lid subunit RPN8/RPN11